MNHSMLADGLCGAYRWTKNEKTFLSVDPLCLQWTYRGVRLVEEIIACSADIIALEECDQISFLMKYLEPRGYGSIFQEKTASPIRHVLKDIANERQIDPDSIKMNNDGVAIIYKKEKFELVDEGKVQRVDMKKNEEKVMGLAVPLKIRAINESILCVVTHLKSTKSEKGEQLRERQINLLLKELIKNENNLPVILCCDLNANPVVNKKGYDPLCYNSIVSADNLNFSSVYKMANGEEPQFTTFKLREHGTDKHCLDYIFVKGGKWKVTKVLEIPKAPENAKALIPNWNYPSDHFSICAQLTWTE